MQNHNRFVYAVIKRGKALLCLVFIPFAAVSQFFVNVAEPLGVSALPNSINFGSGLSFFDFDQDGRDDMSFTMTNDTLVFYRNIGIGFEPLPLGIFGDGETKHVLWVDYDNDGDLDLAIAINNGRHALYRNDGDFQFTDVSAEAGLNTAFERYYGLSFCDYDNDGFLDFYACVYSLDEGPDPYQTNNKLYHNNGDGTFTDVTLEAGVGGGVALSFQSVWFDYDNDGLIDLFVINDRLYANKLYRNNGNGTFTNMAAEAGVEFPGHDPMTATVADFDNDGDLDIYLTNTGVPGKMPKLLVNNNDGTFTNLAEPFGLFLSEWTWGAAWIDYNNNTWPDLYVCSSNPSPLLDPVTNYFYFNNSGTMFTNANSLFSGNHIATSFSVAKGDLNNDGYSDLAVLNRNPYDVFLWQNPGGSNNYIKITPHGTASNAMAIGTWVEVFAGGNTYRQWTMCGENYLAQNSQHLIFGLGQINTVDSVKVSYNRGHTDTYYNLEINAHHHFTEGETYALNIEPEGPIIICDDAPLTLNAGEHHSYNWSTGHQGSTIEVTSSGTYTLTVTTAHGVVVSDSVTVTFSEPPFIDPLITQPSCFDTPDGSIALEFPNNDVMQVAWEGGNDGSTLLGLPAGWYTATVVTNLGCAYTGQWELIYPDPIELTVFTTDANEGESDGIITLFASGAVAPLTYLINGVIADGPIIDGLEGGSYTVTVIDANGCSAEAEAVVNTIPVGVSEWSEPSLLVFPNPTTGEVTLVLPYGVHFETIGVYDASGRQAAHINQEAPGRRFRLILAPGHYVIRCYSQSATLQKAIVVTG